MRTCVFISALVYGFRDGGGFSRPSEEMFWYLVEKTDRNAIEDML